MTFSEWYAANVEPAVIQNANQLPDPEQRKIVLQAARDSMAACWNAALDAAMKYDCGDTMDPVDYEPLKALSVHSDAVMQKNSQ